MSIVVTLYPANATKEELLGLLLAEKFTKTIYFLDPFPKGSLYYKWFETKEYRSIDGMEAVIFPVSVKPDKKKPKPLWGLFTRTRVWASAYDQQKQNEVIRKARKAFGGYFDNDAAGRNVTLRPSTYWRIEVK